MKTVVFLVLTLGLSSIASAQFQPPIVPDADYNKRIEKIADHQLKNAGYTPTERAAALPLIRAKLDLNRLRDNIDPCLRAIARWSEQDTCWVKLNEPVALATHNYMAATQLSSNESQQKVDTSPHTTPVVSVSPDQSKETQNLFLTDTKPVDSSVSQQPKPKAVQQKKKPSPQVLAFADKLVDRAAQTATVAMTLNNGRGGTVTADKILPDEAPLCNTDIVGYADGIVRFTLADSCQVDAHTTIPGLEVAAAINASSPHLALVGNTAVCTGKVCALNFE